MNHRDCYLPIAPKHTRFIDMNERFYAQQINIPYINIYFLKENANIYFLKENAIHYNVLEENAIHYFLKEIAKHYNNELKNTATEVLSRCHTQFVDKINEIVYTLVIISHFKLRPITFLILKEIA